MSEQGAGTGTTHPLLPKPSPNGLSYRPFYAEESNHGINNAKTGIMYKLISGFQRLRVKHLVILYAA